MTNEFEPFLQMATGEVANLVRLMRARHAATLGTPVHIEVPSQLDWSRLIALADRHGLSPHSSEAATSGGIDGCPSAVRETLAAGRRMRQLVNLVLERHPG